MILTAIIFLKNVLTNLVLKMHLRRLRFIVRQKVVVKIMLGIIVHHVKTQIVIIYLEIVKKLGTPPLQILEQIFR